MLPGFYIKTVSGDGSCIIHAFVQGLKALGHTVTFDSVLSSLRTELRKDEYQEACVEGTNVVEEFEKYVNNPLSNYNEDVADMYFEALTMVYEVNVTVFQSDDKKCDILDVNLNKDNNFKSTLYFVCTLSPHFDPIIPIQSDSDSDDSLILTHVTVGGVNDGKFQY